MKSKSLSALPRLKSRGLFRLLDARSFPRTKVRDLSNISTSKKKHLLFVCSGNLNRSPSAEFLFKNNENYEVKSCGINPLAINLIDKYTIKWADFIFCMEEIHKNFILENFSQARKKKIVVLDIRDIYIINDPVLLDILKKKLKRFL